METASGKLDFEAISFPLAALAGMLTPLLLIGAADAAGVQKWQVNITPDGAHVAWSTRATASGTENLAIQTIGDDTSRVTAGSTTHRHNEVLERSFAFLAR